MAAFCQRWHWTIADKSLNALLDKHLGFMSEILEILA